MPDNDVRCPTCGSPNILGPSPDDGLYDCVNCTAWFTVTADGKTIHFTRVDSPGSEDDKDNNEDND